VDMLHVGDSHPAACPSLRCVQQALHCSLGA
jgi:hypothetical protein